MWTVFIAIEAIIILLGLAFTVAGVVVRHRENKLKAICPLMVCADIIDVHKENNSIDDKDTVISYRPVYSYEYNGKTYTVESAIGHKKESEIAKGIKVKLFINPDNPEQIYESGTLADRIGMIFVAVGLLLFAIAVLAVIVFKIFFVSYICYSFDVNGNFDNAMIF